MTLMLRASQVIGTGEVQAFCELQFSITDQLFCQSIF